MKKQTARRRRTVKKPPNKRKAMALTIAFLIAAAVGTWLFVSPMLEKQRMAEAQENFLASIEDGGGEIVLEKPIADIVVDYYEPQAPAAPVSSDAPTEPEPIFWTEAEVETTEDSGEPAVITGLGVLTIEKIDLKMPMADGATSANLKVAAGWVRQTAPIGSTGNAVIAGHRNYDYGSHFNRLGEMEVGDEILYTSKEGESMSFRVYEILEILPGDQEAFVQPEDKAMITLLTCTPIRTATHRLLVRAERITTEGDSQ